MQIVEVFNNIFISNYYDANDAYKLIQLNIGGVLSCIYTNRLYWCDNKIHKHKIYYKDKFIDCNKDLSRISGTKSNEEDKNKENKFAKENLENVKFLNKDENNSDNDSDYYFLNDGHYDYIVYPKEITENHKDITKIHVAINEMKDIDNDISIDFSNISENENLDKGTNTSNDENNKILTVDNLNKYIIENNKIPISNIYKMKHLYLDINDSYDENILNFVNKSESFIDSILSEKKNVLIHCLAGISRCSTIILSYVSKKNKKKIDENYKTMLSKYPFASPNENFYQQLLLYEKMNYNTNVIEKIKYESDDNLESD